MGNNAKMASQGAFGGSRQAIMDAETQRNLMQEQNKTVGQGYSNAYDRAMGQFNTEQGQAKTLADMMSQQGQQQRGIEQEGITADLNEFNTQRDYPMKQVQFLQSMLQGLPISTVSNVPQAQTGAQQAVGGMSTVYQMLQNLGIIPK
jgi:nitrate reductase alpha subunit